MKQKIKILISVGILILYLISIFSFASALNVDSEYITVYPGEEGSIKIKVDNNFNYDIEDVSIALVLDNVPFTSVGSSEKQIDDLDSDDDDTATFVLRASTDAVPGDYDIPYVVTYTNAEMPNATSIQKTGKFGMRISAKTEIDFVVETKNAIVGQQGTVSLKIINKGLGEVKFISVEVTPQGYELISPPEVYLGKIDSDDSDSASYDAVFKSTNPTLTAKIDYKDFDNNNKSQSVNIPFKVYTDEEALQLGLIKKSNTGLYTGIIIVLLIVWFIWRRIKKSRKKNKNIGR